MFCSVCGAQLATEMKHCPTCGARSAAYPAGVCPMTSTGGFGADIVDKTLIGMAVFMIFATFMSWYRVSVNMGDEPIDALANFAARILPAYSGVNTCYGLVSLGVAFMAVILVVCKRYAWAAAVGIAGVALAVAAMFFTPDFVELNTYVGGGGDDSVADLLRSDVVSGMLPDDVRNGAKMASDVLDVVYGYVAVKSCFGLKVYAVTSAAFAALGLVAWKRSCARQ